MIVPPSFTVIEIGSIIVQFPPESFEGQEGSVSARLTQPPEVSQSSREALQELMQLLHQLRLTHPRSPEASPLTAEELVPYVMEEALDVLDALPTKAKIGTDPEFSSALMRLENLSTPILWAIARTAYPVMELLGGMQVNARSPGQPWTSGVLRLVPLLEVSTPQQYWRFDLTTGQEPQQLIDPALQIHLEKDLFLDLQSGSRAASNLSSHSASQHLQNLQNHLAGSHSTLRTLFQGVAVSLLPPESPWLAGELKLNLDFEFMVQARTDSFPAYDAYPGHWVEAELLEERELENGRSTLDGYPRSMPLAVVEIPATLLAPTALVRVAEGVCLDDLTHAAYQQVMNEAIAQIQHLTQPTRAIDPVLSVIRVADALGEFGDDSAINPSIRQNFSLLQPELLMDELVPKLLWQLSRSSYALMRWLGGLPMAILQPDSAWETGTLRLMPVLALSRDDRTWSIDLATGRFIPQHDWPFNPDTVVMILADGAEPTLPLLPSFPIKIETLLAQLLRRMPTNAPDIALLQAAIAVEWLTSEQEWQSGQLALHWGFAWTADVV